MFGQVKWMALLIAAAILTTSSFGAGVWVRDAFCDSAAAKVQLELANGKIKQLTDNITARDDAENALRKQAGVDSAELERLQGKIDEFKTTVGGCFDGADTDGLRKLWNK